MTDKSGGDVSQLNFATQGNASSQDLKGVGSTGPALVGSGAGASAFAQFADQTIQQALAQANLGLGGQGGNDNITANTNITVA